MKLTFYGGVGSTSGINFLLEGAGKKILVDAGLHTGCFNCEKFNINTTPYKAEEMDFIFVSQYHIESVGKIPQLVKEGFKGKIYSTSETKFISEFVLNDYLRGEKKSKVLFDEVDIKKAMALWEVFPYGEKINLNEELSAKLFDAGHVVGSAMINFNYNGKNLLFANAVGNLFVKDLSGLDKDAKINYLVIESVYGNKIHESTYDRKERLENIIEETVNRQGSLFFPIFSIDKIYLILKEVRELMETGRIPKTQIFIDSLLASEAVSVYGRLFKCQEEKGVCQTLTDFLTSFKDIKFVTNEEGLKEMNDYPAPKIIIGGIDASSKKTGDSISQYLTDPNNSIVLVDYQPIGSFGKKLLENSGDIEIEGEKINVMAQIEMIDGYSAHADQNRLFMFVDDLKQNINKTFVVIGEPQASMFFAQKLRDYMGVNASYPKLGESYELDF